MRTGGFRTFEEEPGCRPMVDRLSALSWPLFLLHGNVGRWHCLFEEFARFQLLLIDPDGSLAAVGHCVPLSWDGSDRDLPRSIDGVIGRALDLMRSGEAPNTFAALGVMVDPALRGRSLSETVLVEMRRLASDNSCHRLVAPVRPVLKSLYPLIPMESYSAWRRLDGSLFDPWLRIHERMGAVMISIAPGTLAVEGSVAQWREWTGMDFPGSGSYVVPGALQPVRIDLESDSGRYEDPNCWMVHSFE